MSKGNKTVMAKITIVTDENRLTLNPQWKQWKQRVVKVELHQLDGSTQEAKFYFPIFTWSTDALELAGLYISEVVRHWTKHYLKIKSFQVRLGSVNNTGKEKYDLCYELEEIPLNKVFVPKYPSGKYMRPETVKKREQAQRLKRS